MDISDSDYLDALARRFVISQTAIDAAESIVADDINQGATLGIQGVPHIIIDQNWVVSGAQSPQSFIPLFDTVIASKH